MAWYHRSLDRAACGVRLTRHGILGHDRRIRVADLVTDDVGAYAVIVVVVEGGGGGAGDLIAVWNLLDLGTAIHL